MDTADPREGARFARAVVEALRVKNDETRRLTYDELAEATNLSRSTVARMFGPNNARQAPVALSTVVDICRALGIDPGEFIAGVEQSLQDGAD